jgi:hypothetical protein
MVDMFANDQSRGLFQEATDQAAAADDSDDAEMVLRRLLSNEPLAILYCVDGSYVKASPSILKTTNRADDTLASVQMREMIQKSYKDHLARNKGDDFKAKHFGAAEVTCEVSTQVTVLVTSRLTCFTYLHRTWDSF